MLEQKRSISLWSEPLPAPIAAALPRPALQAGPGEPFPHHARCRRRGAWRKDGGHEQDPGGRRLSVGKRERVIGIAYWRTRSACRAPADLIPCRMAMMPSGLTPRRLRPRRAFRGRVRQATATRASGRLASMAVNGSTAVTPLEKGSG